MITKVVRQWYVIRITIELNRALRMYICYIQGCPGVQGVSQSDESSSINDVNIYDLNVDCSFLTVQNKLKLLCLNR